MRGDVFKITLNVVASADPHWIVVLDDGVSENVVVVAVVTSQVEKRRRFITSRGLPAETLVEFSEKEYAPLSKASCVDCNSVRVVQRKHFSAQLRLFGKRAMCPPFPRDLFVRVMAGALLSPRVPDEVKDILRRKG